MSHLYTLWKQIWKSYNGSYSIHRKEVETLLSFLISGSVVLFLAGVLFTFLKKGLSIFSKFALIGLKLYGIIFVGVLITYVFYCIHYYAQ